MIIHFSLVIRLVSCKADWTHSVDFKDELLYYFITTSPIIWNSTTSCKVLKISTFVLILVSLDRRNFLRFNWNTFLTRESDCSRSIGLHNKCQIEFYSQVDTWPHNPHNQTNAKLDDAVTNYVNYIEVNPVRRIQWRAWNNC